MIRFHSFVVFGALSSFALACGGTTSAVDPVSTDPNACGASACGPLPAQPQTVCDDGLTLAGPTGVCRRDDDGVCRHEIRECPAPVARACGGMNPDQPPCAANEFCDYAPDAMCGAADATGVCRVRPEACTREFMPVCGCDDNTYPNACTAAAAGVAVGASGECAPRVGNAGDTCGTRGVPPCGEGLFCNFPAGANCGRADAPGTCAAKPETCDARVRRVCGCDGTTYPNACSANLAGVSVETNGACRAR